MTASGRPGRRTVVSRRAVIQGAAAAVTTAWVTPVIQIVGMSVAHADTASGQVCKVPSHAVVIVRYAGVVYGLKIEGGRSRWESVGGNPADLAALRANGWVTDGAGKKKDSVKQYADPQARLVDLLSDGLQTTGCEIIFTPPAAATVLYAHVFDASQILPAVQDGTAWVFRGIDGNH